MTVCSVNGASGVQLDMQYNPTTASGIQSVAKSSRAAATPPVVDCGGATGRYLQIWLPGQGRLFPAEEVRVHRAWLPGSRETPSRTAPAKQMACYGLQARQVPSADDPDVLANTKRHPYLVEPNNPEDPIFYSTCYIRALVRDWLPLLNEVQSEPSTPPWSFGNRTHCLDCTCYTDTASPENGIDYNITTMNTPQWWLQPEGQCRNFDKDCNYEILNSSPQQAGVGGVGPGGKTDPVTGTGTSDTGSIVGGVFAVLASIALIAIVVFVAFRYNAAKKRRGNGAGTPAKRAQVVVTDSVPWADRPAQGGANSTSTAAASEVPGHKYGAASAPPMAHEVDGHEYHKSVDNPMRKSGGSDEGSRFNTFETAQ